SCEHLFGAHGHTNTDTQREPHTHKSRNPTYQQDIPLANTHNICMKSTHTHTQTHTNIQTQHKHTNTAQTYKHSTNIQTQHKHTNTAQTYTQKPTAFTLV